MSQIPVDTLRAWERRYGVVAPERGGGSARLYAEEDVERLKLIRRLVEGGHAISSIARLPRVELEAMAELHTAGTVSKARADARLTTVLAFSDAPPCSLDRAKAAAIGITQLGEYRSWPAFESEALARKPDALIVELSALFRDRVDDVRRLARRAGSVRTIVVYGFATEALTQKLLHEGIVTLRAPVDHEQLVRELGRPPPAVIDVAGVVEPRPLAPLFDEQALAHMASVTTAVQCECPHHLVDIVRTLAGFEVYSAECENSNVQDAALHAKLRATAATARSLFERALIEVAEYEDIALPDSVTRGNGAGT